MNTCPICLRVNADDAYSCALCGYGLRDEPVDDVPAVDETIEPVTDKPPDAITPRVSVAVSGTPEPQVVYHLGGARLRPSAPGAAEESPNDRRAASPGPTSLTSAAPVSSFAPESVRTLNDATHCASCGRPWLAGHTYCACGAQRAIPDPPVAPQKAAPNPTMPWYTKPLWVLRRNRRFHVAMRTANDGARLRFDQPLTERTRGIRWATAAVLVALVASQIGSTGVGSRHWLVTHVPFVSRLFYTPIPELAAKQATGEVVLPPAGMIGKAAKPWTSVWPAQSGGTCPDLSQAADSAVITFGGVYDVDLIAIRAGLGSHDAKAPGESRPKRLEIQFSDGSCEALGLANTSAEQRFTVPRSLGRHATGAVVAIVGVYPQQSGSGPHVSMRSVDFSSLRWSD